MKRVVVIPLLLCCFLLCNAQRRNTSRRNVQKVETVENVTQKVDELFEENFDVAHPANTFDSTQCLITNYIVTLNTTLKKKMQEHYYEAFFFASENEQLDSAVICAFKYLMTDGRKDENVMWQVLIDNYGCDGDTENTCFLIDGFRRVSEARENAYTEAVDSLSAKYEEVIHPVPFEEVVKGYWISLDNKYDALGSNLTLKVQDKTTPDYILRINDVTCDAGTTLLVSPTLPWKAKKWGDSWSHSLSDKYYQLQFSQKTFCDVNTKELSLTFASQKVKEGNTDFARQQIDANRKLQANMHGTIYSSNASFGNKLAAGVITDVTTSLFDNFATKMAAGSVTNQVYCIQTMAISSKVMDASISYKRVKDSSLGYSITEENQQNKPNRFVKWEESDSVVFISSKGKPIFIDNLSKNSPLLAEYYKIRKKHNIWRPQYLLPILACVGVGTAMNVKAWPLVLSDKNNYSEDEYKSRVKKGAILGALGLTIAITSIPIVYNTMIAYRQKAFNKINKKNMEKMRQKAEFSIQPNIDPVDSSGGIDVTINF